MSLLTMWLIGWAACSLGSAMAFAWWMHAMKQRFPGSPAGAPLVVHNRHPVTRDGG